MPTLNKECQAIKPTAGAELQDRLQYTLNQIADIRAAAMEKLEKIATPVLPASGERGKEKHVEYPSYFEEAFSKLGEMMRILNDIQDLINRVDL